MPNFCLPSLLDRLVDEQPRRTEESAQDRSLLLSDYQQLVMRDLSRLLNADSLPESLNPAPGSGPQVPLALQQFPAVQESVLNYGVQDQGGHYTNPDLQRDLQYAIHQAIQRFEPRVENVEVRLIDPDEVTIEAEKKLLLQKLNQGRIGFEIRAVLYAEPHLEFLRVKSELDLISGRHQLSREAH